MTSLSVRNIGSDICVLHVVRTLPEPRRTIIFCGLIPTRLPTLQPSALLYWARIPERQFPTIHNILRDGSVTSRRDQPLEREDTSVILSRTAESSPKLMTDRCGDQERHGIDQQFRARAAGNTVRR